MALFDLGGIIVKRALYQTCLICVQCPFPSWFGAEYILFIYFQPPCGLLATAEATPIQPAGRGSTAAATFQISVGTQKRSQNPGDLLPGSSTTYSILLGKF